MKHEYLTQSEIIMLDMLSTTLITCHELPPQLNAQCELLRTHGFARVRNISKHGENSYQAWDITDEGQYYLIKHYKKQGGHV